MSTPSLGPIDTGKQPKLPVGTPYCANCGYDLSASAESARCPECGKPLIEVLARVSAHALPGMQRTRRYTSTATIWGMPFVSIAFGPRLEAGERFGRARGFIALGDVATGVIALGGRTMGVVSVGGFSVGVFSVGGFSIGGLMALGGTSVALPGIACGGMAVGGASSGGMSVGVIAQGGMAVGVFAKGAAAVGLYVISRGRNDPQAQSVFDAMSFLWPSSSTFSMAAVAPIIIVLGSTVLVGLLLFALGQVFKKEPVDAA